MQEERTVSAKIIRCGVHAVASVAHYGWPREKVAEMKSEREGEEGETIHHVEYARSLNELGVYSKLGTIGMVKWKS